jgi:hypothetical protein
MSVMSVSQSADQPARQPAARSQDGRRRVAKAGSHLPPLPPRGGCAAAQVREGREQLGAAREQQAEAERAHSAQLVRSSPCRGDSKHAHTCSVSRRGAAPRSGGADGEPHNTRRRLNIIPTPAPLIS